MFKINSALQMYHEVFLNRCKVDYKVAYIGNAH